MPKMLEFRDHAAYDLGKWLGLPVLEGVQLTRTPQGAKLTGVPGSVSAFVDQVLVSEGETVRFDQELELWQGDQLIITVSPVTRLPQATLERWGRGKLALDGQKPVSFNLGGLAPVDIGKRLDLPSLGGFVLVLGKGGMRILSVPEGLEVRTEERPLQLGDKIAFGRTTEIKDGDRSVAQLSFLNLENAPAPKAQLDYIGARPLQFRKSLALFEEMDLGRHVPDPLLRRLRLSPAEGGARIVHIPGGLLLGSPTYRELSVGMLVPCGQSIYIRDLSTREGLGIIDISEP